MITQLAASSALTFGRSAPCRQGRRCGPDHISYISTRLPASKVCHFRLPLTPGGQRRFGAVEALRVLRTTRKTAMKCRRAALQQLHNKIIAAPEEVRDQVRNLTRMQRLRTCAA